MYLSGRCRVGMGWEVGGRRGEGAAERKLNKNVTIFSEEYVYFCKLKI